MDRAGALLTPETINFRNWLAARPGGRCLGQIAIIDRCGFPERSER